MLKHCCCFTLLVCVALASLVPLRGPDEKDENEEEMARALRLLWKCTGCHFENKLFDSVCLSCDRVQLFSEISPQLTQISLSCVKEWSHLDASQLRIAILTGGLSNRLFRVDVTTDGLSASDPSTAKAGVIRVFNPRTPLSIEQLHSVFDAYQSAGFGTRVLGSFGAGHIEEFITGHQCTDLQLLQNAEDYTVVAHEFAVIHKMQPLHFDRGADVIDKRMLALIDKVDAMFPHPTDHWLLTLCAELRNDEWQALFDETSEMETDDAKSQVEEFCTVGTVPVSEQCSAARSPLSVALRAVWAKLRSDLKQLCESESHKAVADKCQMSCNDAVFSHCDLHSGNLIRVEKTDSAVDDASLKSSATDTSTDIDAVHLKVVDYEYSCFAPRVFDLGNFLNELYIDNFWELEPFFKVHEKRRALAELLLDEFLQQYVASTSAVKLKPAMAQQCVDNLKEAVVLGKAMSHFMWALWAVIESQRKDVDWNYGAYGKTRYTELWKLLATDSSATRAKM